MRFYRPERFTRIRSIGLTMLVGLVALSTGSTFTRGQSPSEVPDTALTPYQKALLNYKSGNYGVAKSAIDDAEKAKPGDPATEILKARILTEQLDFEEAKKALTDLNGKPGLTPEISYSQTLALGDLCLRKRSFDEATKFYESLLAQKPKDPDLILKIVYSRLGASDFITAEKDASQLKPLDPDHPSYYFAKAAIAQATGNSAVADEDIETVRTMYGITVANHYLKTYLEFFTASDKSPASKLTVPGTTNAPPQQP